jgi:hypothetical protein
MKMKKTILIQKKVNLIELIRCIILKNDKKNLFSSVNNMNLVIQILTTEKKENDGYLIIIFFLSIYR